MEDEGEREEPEVCTRSQMEFDCACTSMGDGTLPAMAEGQAQGYFARYYFLSSQPYLILIQFWYLVLVILALMWVLMVTWSLPLCFSGYTGVMMG